jgi:mitogen-activated protein kinase kinase 3
MKNYMARPNYNQLLELSFIMQHAEKDTNVADFVEEILNLPDTEQST